MEKALTEHHGRIVDIKKRTPMAFVRAMVSGCQRAGLDPWPTLMASQITPDDLTQADGKISARQMENVSSSLMRLMDDEALGTFRRRLPWGTYGMLARASLSAPSLGVAISRWCRHHFLLTDDIDLRLTTDETGRACISLTEQRTACWLKGEIQEFCHVSILRNIIGLASWLADSILTLTHTEFAFPEPMHSSTYSALFPCPCEFNHNCSKIYFPVAFLGLSPCRNEQALQTMLKRALPLTVHIYRKDKLLVNRIEQLFKINPACMRNAEATAAALNLSTRTLHRQLKEQGDSLQAIKYRIRTELAKDLMARTKKPIKQIAHSTGLRSEKSILRILNKSRSS